MKDTLFWLIVLAGLIIYGVIKKSAEDRAAAKKKAAEEEAKGKNGDGI